MPHGCAYRGGGALHARVVAILRGLVRHLEDLLQYWQIVRATGEVGGGEASLLQS